jgi:hypothetical protein
MSHSTDPTTPRFGATFEEELQTQADVLQSMFDDPGLTRLRSRAPSHPAVWRYDSITRLLRQKGQWASEEEDDLFGALAAMVFDRTTWAFLQEQDDFWAFLSNADARRKVQSRIRNPTTFDDVLAELFIAGWLRSKGVAAELLEKEGFPDLELEWDHRPSWAEVKRIRVGTSVARIQAVLKRANTQIKRTQGTGVVYILIGRPAARAAFDDRTPSDIRPYVAEVERRLASGLLRSVSEVVLVWDDRMIFDDVSGQILHAFRRTSRHLSHRAPRSACALPKEALTVGSTFVMRGHYKSSRVSDSTSLPPITTGSVKVSPMFRDNNNVAGGIRVPHAVEALSDPDDRRIFEIGGLSFILATRKVSTGKDPYVMLLVAKTEGGEVELLHGFRLYQPRVQLDQLANDPFLAFQVLLSRYGLPVSVGNQHGLLVPFARFDAQGGGDATSIVSGQCPKDESFVLGAFIKVLEKNPRQIEASWVFGVNTSRYFRAARDHRS